MIRRLFGFSKPEVRNQPYSDAVVSAIQQAVAGGSTNINRTAALEIAASTIAKSFSSLEIEPVNQVTECLTPSVLGMIGRELIRTGECLFVINVTGGTVNLIPCNSFDIRGDYREESWFYRCSVFGPTTDGNFERLLPSAAVVHCRYSCDPATPWIGISPLGWSRQTADLHNESESALLDESKSPRGTIIPVSTDGGQSKLDKMRESLKALRGGLALLPGMNLIGDAQGLVRREYEMKRLGFNSPPTLIDLHDKTALAVLAACGIPIELVTKSGDSGQRESWRRHLFGTVNPLVKLVQAELRKKLDQPELELKTDALFASDLAGRARAFGSMVSAGMAVDKAAALCGLVTDD